MPDRDLNRLSRSGKIFLMPKPEITTLSSQVTAEGGIAPEGVSDSASSGKGSCEIAATLGGQAVLEGIMMRSKTTLAIAVRKPDGSIIVERRPWYSFTKSALARRPFVRGFPILVETMINGIKALNFSAVATGEAEAGTEIKGWHLTLTLIVAVGFALGLFVVVPHLLSLFLNWLHIAGGAESVSFHAWDGLFKFLVFIGYIAAIALLPDIRRVFQYHGAEHKVIWAYERKVELNSFEAAAMSRLHPRCGTTFLLYVLGIAIILHAVLVPMFLWMWTPENPVLKHAVLITFKLLLMVPISAMAYEAIKASSGMGDSWLSRAARAPGLLLQLMTTREPDAGQLEVALVALKEALGADAPYEIATPAYTVGAS